MKADLVNNRIWLSFAYDKHLVGLAKRIPGASWNANRKVWSYPLNLKTARILRETFPNLEPSDALKRWSRDAARLEMRGGRKSTASDATLAHVPRQLLDTLRPYQRADVSFMAQGPRINANQAGLGKTREVVAATFEAQIPSQPRLIVAPVTSLEAVWQHEIQQWCGIPVFAGTSRLERKKACEQAFHLIERGEPVWLCVNPELIRGELGEQAISINWGAIVVDEFQTFGLSNPKTQFSQALRALSGAFRWPLSGSPLGGVPLNLWAILNWVDPDAFPSRWQWANQWLQVHDNGFGTRFGAVKTGREDEFWRYHAPWLLRRLKSEVVPELPPKTYRDVWVKMQPAQQRQYRQFERDAEIRISGQTLIGTSKLTEWTRLKFFAFGLSVIKDGVLWPTAKSPKIEALVANLNHHDREPALVFSQSRKVVEVVTAELIRLGHKAEMLTGKTKNRAELVRSFQAGEIEVLVIVTKAAGVSVTLDRADTVHILDQTWNPDNQEQAEDRAHRLSRMHNVTVYYYRTRDTLEESINLLNLEKTRITTSILDGLRSKLLRTRTGR